MYSIGICGEHPRYITAAQLSAALSEVVNATIHSDQEIYRDAFHSLAAIERICSRGISYSNEDFDVLSHAHSILTRYNRVYGAPWSGSPLLLPA